MKIYKLNDIQKHYQLCLKELLQKYDYYFDFDTTGHQSNEIDYIYFQKNEDNSIIKLYLNKKTEKLKFRYIENLSVCIERFEFKNSAYWNETGIMLYKKTFYRIDDNCNNNSKVFCDDFEELKKIDELRYQRAHSHDLVYKPCSNSMINAVYKYLNKQRGCKHIPKYRIENVIHKTENRNYYKITFSPCNNNGNYDYIEPRCIYL